jgi:hypothetical protein
MKCDQEVVERFGRIRDSVHAGISRVGGRSVFFQDMGRTSLTLAVEPETLQAAPADLGRVTEYCQCPFAHGGNCTSHSTEQPIGYRRCKCKTSKRSKCLLPRSSWAVPAGVRRGPDRSCFLKSSRDQDLTVDSEPSNYKAEALGVSSMAAGCLPCTHCRFNTASSPNPFLGTQEWLRQIRFEIRLGVGVGSTQRSNTKRPASIRWWSQQGRDLPGSPLLWRTEETRSREATRHGTECPQCQG